MRVLGRRHRGTRTKHRAHVATGETFLWPFKKTRRPSVIDEESISDSEWLFIVVSSKRKTKPVIVICVWKITEITSIGILVFKNSTAHDNCENTAPQNQIEEVLEEFTCCLCFQFSKKQNYQAVQPPEPSSHLYFVNSTPTTRQSVH
ncbi:doublecortin domain-containing protein 1-like [Passer domesticus]|uniref:doublecortin domain-containing protein 1-like n=1 Tax=Passer domesticus TaxID=48849 RepID=UPI0030FF1CD8